MADNKNEVGDNSDDSSKIHKKDDVVDENKLENASTPDTTREDAGILSRRPTPKELGRLSRLVDMGSYEMLFIELGLSFQEIEQLNFDFSYLPMITKCTRLFLRWTNSYPNRTFHHIEQAMKYVGMATDCILEVIEASEEIIFEDIVPNDVLARPPSDDEIEKISTFIDSSFFNFFLELGLSPQVIEQHMISTPPEFRLTVKRLLNHWKELVNEATIGRLLMAMKLCQMDWYAAAQIFVTCLENNDTREKKYQQQQQQQHFTSGISKNEDRPCNITITVIGHKGAGKSCFVRQIQQEFIPKGGPGSTDIADLYVNYLAFNLNTGSRKKLDENGKVETGRQRLKRIIDQYRKGEKTDMQTKLATVGAPVSISPSNSQSSSTKITEVQQSPSHLEEIKRIKLSLEQRNFIEEIMTTKTELEDKQTKGFITIYDFGGEKVFYNTHHCFMSSNMVFVLVFDVAMCQDSDRSKDGYENIEDWLRSIATYAIDQATLGKGTPPVIIVGSHLDEVSSDEKSQGEAFSAVLEELYNNPQLREIMETHVQEMYYIANLNDSSKNQGLFESVWNKIIEVAPFQSQWGKQVPARWLALEHYLLKRKNTGDIIITYEKLLEINRESAVPLAEHEILDFLRNLRLVGHFLYFELHGKSSFIVLRPQWIVDAFKAITTAPTSSSMKLNIEWRQYQRSGKIRINFLKQLWQCHEDRSFVLNFETLYSVMETLGLLAKPLSDNEEVEYFIVPSMLQTAKPEKIRPVLDDPDIVKTITLCLKFDNPFIPQAVWDKMIAACLHSFQQLHEQGHDGTEFIQRGFVCLCVNSLWNMIINCSKNAMKVTMFKKDTNKSIRPHAGVELRGILESHLNRILELNHQGHLKYQFYLHNDYRFTDDEKMVKVDDLRKELRLPCHSSNGIVIKDLSIWFKYPDQKNSENETEVKEVHAEMIRKLSKWIDPCLPKNWETFQTLMEPYLDHSDIYGDHVKCFNDICLKLMSKGVISYGNYSKLRCVVEKIHVEAVNIIDEASSKINDIQHG